MFIGYTSNKEEEKIKPIPMNVCSKKHKIYQKMRLILSFCGGAYLQIGEQLKGST